MFILETSFNKMKMTDIQHLHDTELASPQNMISMLEAPNLTCTNFLLVYLRYTKRSLQILDDSLLTCFTYGLALMYLVYSASLFPDKISPMLFSVVFIWHPYGLFVTSMDNDLLHAVSVFLFNNRQV